MVKLQSLKAYNFGKQKGLLSLTAQRAACET